MRHHCHAVGCEKPVPPRYLMCRRHWSMVPEPLQAALYASYRRGQERDKMPSAAWIAAAARCRADVARQEGREAAAKYCDRIAQLADQRAQEQGT